MPKTDTDQKQNLLSNTHNPNIYKLKHTEHYILINICHLLNLDYHKVKNTLKQTTLINLIHHEDKERNTTYILFPKDEFPEFIALTQHLYQ